MNVVEKYYTVFAICTYSNILLSMYKPYLGLLKMCVYLDVIIYFTQIMNNQRWNYLKMLHMPQVTKIVAEDLRNLSKWRVFKFSDCSLCCSKETMWWKCWNICFTTCSSIGSVLGPCQFRDLLSRMETDYIPHTSICCEILHMNHPQQFNTE